ncbi:hypothetical protein NC653_038852 [Populus alba x Populus x berolinensis]|uniref:Uncharacterized protein n=1 Tax=Populus alba x Populus x berolinensis TaxID=444605 RepID=A0AAD6LI79_9ROSI|nr:hypothetical protein NC653_038852 [Populus alba x Populus x berolinensis]
MGMLPRRHVNITLDLVSWLRCGSTGYPWPRVSWVAHVVRIVLRPIHGFVLLCEGEDVDPSLY